MNLLSPTYGYVLFLNPVCYSMSFDWGIEAIYIQCYCWEVVAVSSHFYSLFSFAYSLFTGLLA
jgi:hypothetical protein